MSRAVATLSWVTLISLSPASAFAAEPPDASADSRIALDDRERIKALDAEIRALLGTQQTALSIGVLHRGHLWFSAYGKADVEKNVTASSKTSYRLASVAKPFTAVTAMMLADEGKLSLDEDVRTYVPSFPMKPWTITVRQLLAHLGGVSHYRGYPGEHQLQTHHDTAQSLALFQDWDLVAEPGTRFVYSTYGYNLLAAVVEQACEKPFGECVAEHIFDPLGMQDTRLEDPAARTSRWATGYNRRTGKPARTSFVDISSRFGGGGMRGTIEDLIRFARGLIDGKLLPQGTWREMTTAQSTRDGQSTDYGLGFGVYPQRGHYVVSHSGGQPETATLLLMVPAERFAIALASNLEENGPLLGEVAAAATEQLLDGGLRRRPAYAERAEDGVFYEALSRIHSYGLAAHSMDRDEPSADMKALNALLTSPTMIQVREGHQPKQGALFIKVGAGMAKRVERSFGTARLEEDRVAGPLQFFADYSRACGEATCAPLAPAIQSRVEALLSSWTRANSEELSRLRLSSKTPRAAAAKALRESAKGNALRPDFRPELERLLKHVSDPNQAARWRQLMDELYPLR
ncbi:MAG: serine hydrolase domain-containing protein [Myxococcaceae bacterium]